jgi:hypothetical protein
VNRRFNMPKELRSVMILVSKVVEGEIAVIAETEEKAREIAMDLASNHPDTYLDNDTDVVVDSVRSASDHDLEYLIFNGANGSEWDAKRLIKMSFEK